MLSKHGKSPSTMEFMVPLFKEHFAVFAASSVQNRILRMFDMLWLFGRKIRQTDYLIIDVYSTWNFYYALVFSMLSRLFNKKYVLILHGGNLPSRLDSFPKISSSIFKHSYKNVSPSGYLKHEFESRGFPCILIPNIINIDEYPFKKREVVGPKLLYVRSIHKVYNPILAVKCLRLLLETYPNAKLCMIGPVRDESIDELNAYILENKLSPSIEITGMLSRQEWVSRSMEYDIFINTTTVDNTPVSVMEAMALGMPIVSTNVGGIPYLIEESRNGLLFESGDIKEMLSAIISLIKNSELASTISDTNRKKAESLTWESVRHTWLDLLS